MKRVLQLSALLATVGAIGFAAALTFTGAASADWSIGNLPQGFSATHTIDSSAQTCSEWYVVQGYAATSQHLCTDSPTFQQDLDSFISANCPQAVCDPPTTSTTDTSPTTGTGVSTTPDGGASTVVAPPGSSPPVASFTTVPQGLSVVFTDTSTPGSSPISTVTWLFGDGANGVGATIPHVYASSGDFTVIELVTDMNGLTNRVSKEISVSPFEGTAAFAEKTSSPLSTAATTAYAAPVGVYCVSSWGKAKTEDGGYGLSIVGSHQANMWQAGCQALTSKRGPIALAMLVLGHEAAHALGIVNERTADCYSLKRIPLLERALKITDTVERKNAAAIVKRHWGASCRG